MSGEDLVVDIRGEPCGMPALRVEKVMDHDAQGAPFTVIGDRDETLDQLRLLAARKGWTCEAAASAALPWRARFLPPAARR